MDCLRLGASGVSVGSSIRLCDKAQTIGHSELRLGLMLATLLDAVALLFPFAACVAPASFPKAVARFASVGVVLKMYADHESVFAGAKKYRVGLLAADKLCQ